MNKYALLLFVMFQLSSSGTLVLQNGLDGYSGTNDVTIFNGARPPITTVYYNTKSVKANLMTLYL